MARITTSPPHRAHRHRGGPPEIAEKATTRSGTGRSRVWPSCGIANRVPGANFGDPRLARVYDALDADRSSLDVYVDLVTAGQDGDRCRRL